MKYCWLCFVSLRGTRGRDGGPEVRESRLTRSTEPPYGVRVRRRFTSPNSPTSLHVASGESCRAQPCFLALTCSRYS